MSTLPRRGAYPALHHHGNGGALTSSEDNNVAPVPVVHPANGIQHNMAATSHSGGLRVAYRPYQWHEGLYQLGSQASTGFQHPKFRDSALTPQSSHHRISREANPNFSSDQGTAQSSSYCGKSANENFARQSINNDGQEREYSEQKGSNVNINTGQQQRHLNVALSVCTNSSAHQGDDLQVMKLTFPLENQCFSEPKSKEQQYYPLLCSLLEEGTYSNPSQQQAPPPSPGIQPATEKVSPVAEVIPPTDDQIQDFIAQKVAYYRKSLIRHGINYDDDANFNEGLPKESILQSDCNMPESNGVTQILKTSAKNQEDVVRQSLVQCTSAAGQALGDECSKSSKANTELTPKSQESDDCTTSSTKKHSSEYPQIMREVAATCTKNEDLSPVVLSAVPRMTLDKLAEKHPSSLLNCSLSQEGFKSLGFNSSRNLNGIEHLPVFSSSVKHMTERDKGDKGLKPVEATGLDSVQDVTISEDLPSKSSSVVSENKTLEVTTLIQNRERRMETTEDQQHCDHTYMEAHSKLNLSNGIHNVSTPANQSEDQYNRAGYEGVRQNVVSLSSQNDLSEKECKEVLFVNNLKDPQYEDISDYEDISPYFKNPQYEDVSEDENPQIENKAVERPLSIQVPISNSKLSPIVGERDNDVQGRAQMKTETISEEIIPKKQISPEMETFDIEQHCFAETDDGFKDILDKHLGRQTNHSLPGSPPSSSEEGETDDWIVIPISLSDLEFEPGDEDQESLLDNGESGQKETECDKSSTDSYKPWPDSLSSDKLNEFDTFECFLKFMERQSQKRPEVAACWPTPEPKDSTGGQRTPQNWSEPYSESDDSCDTEDSCDYSFGSESNRLAVPRQMLEKKIAPLLPESDDSASEKESEEEGVTNMQEGQSRSLDKLRCIVMAMNNATNYIENKTRGQKISKRNDEIIIIDSDSEDENYQTCKKKPEQKRLLYSGDAPCSQQRRHSAETVGSAYGTIKEMPSADQAAPQPWSKHHNTQLKEETSEQLIENKGSPKQVQHNGKKNAVKDIVINLDSDTEDDSDQNYKNATRKRFSFGTVEGSDVPHFQQKMHSSEVVKRKYGTAEEKLKETRLLSADSSLLQRQSKCHDRPFTEKPQGACSDLSHTTKQSAQLTEAKGGSERVQHKANRPGMSRRNAKRKILSGSEDHGNSLLVKKNRHSTESVDCLYATNDIKLKKTKLSSEKLTMERAQPVDKEAVSTSGPNPVIPRYIVMKSPQSPKHVKECRVHMQGTDTGEKNTQNMKRNKKGRFVSKQKLAKDRHHSTANRAHVGVGKPSLVSKRQSLPCQEGPSTSTSFMSGNISEARQSSASLRVWSRWNSSPSTLAHPVTPTKDQLPSSTTHLSARKRVTRDWKNSHFPTRRDRKSDLGMDEDLQTTDQTKTDHLCREARPGQGHCHKAPRRRHGCHDTETPLMKKAKFDAIEWTKAINREPPRERRSYVSDGYKWSAKPSVAQAAKGSSR